MERAEQIRARNAYLIARHRCVQCRRQDEVTLAGSRLCGRCKEQQRERSRIRYAENPQRDIARVKALREARKAAGLCVVCGGERDREGLLTCAACLAKHRRRCKEYNERRGRQHDIARAKALREARKAAGLCVVCGGERDRDDRLTCSACLEKERQRRRESRGQKRRRREDGT